MKHTLTHLAALLLAGLTPVFVSAQNLWEDLNGPYDNITLRDIYVKGDTLLAVGGDLTAFQAYVLTSLDGGTTWDSSIVGAPQLLRSIDFADAQTGIITSVNSSSCVLRTTDGGMQWTWEWCDLDSNFTGGNQVQFLNATDGYMLGWGSTSFSSGSIYSTSDAGVTWSHVTGSLPGLPFEFAQWLDAQNGYAGSFLFGTLNLHRTSDGGQTWSADLDGDSLGFSDAHFFDVANGIVTGNVGSNTVIWQTNNSGNSWQELATLPDVFMNSIAFRDEDHGVAVGNAATFPLESRIYETEDGGTTWTEVTAVSTPSSLTKVRYFEGRYYALSDAGDVFRSPQQMPSSTGDRHAQSVEVRVYPNPAQDHLFLEVSSSERSPLQFDLFDATGKKVVQRSVAAGTTNIPLQRQQLPAGVYHYRLQADGTFLDYGTIALW